MDDHVITTAPDRSTAIVHEACAVDGPAAPSVRRPAGFAAGDAGPVETTAAGAVDKLATRRVWSPS
jgi:hypothetical protein